MYNGYDQQGIKRVFAETVEDAKIVAREYLNSRLDCKFIRFYKLSRNNKPMLKYQFKVLRIEE